MIKKKTRFRFRLNDVIVTVVCVLVCLVAIGLFWRDMNSTTVRSDKDVIATISFKYKIAQRKFDDRVVWERLQQNSSLYNMDTVRTADLAEAYVTFVDNTELKLQENTMIQVSYDPKEGINLSVSSGNIAIDTTKSEGTVNLDMGNGTKVNLASGSSLTASMLKGGEGSVQLQAGYGSVQGAEGNINLAPGESAKMEEGGKISKADLTVTSIASDLKILKFDEKESVPVHIEWNISDNYSEKPVVVETSRNKDFSVIENIYSATGSSSIDVEAEEGTLYWRVYPENQKETPVEGKVRVVQIEPVVTTAPASSAVYSYRKENPDIQFGWTGNDFADHYKIEVASEPSFTEESIKINQDVSSSRVNFDSLAEGEYYWRVTPYYVVEDLGYGDSTPPKKFTVEKKEKAEPPLLSSPADNSRLVYTSEEIPANFMWKSEVAEADYNVVVARDEEFTDIVYSGQTEDTRIKNVFNTENMADGEYYWKVVRNSDEDVEAAESMVRKFTVEAYVPGVNRLVFPPEGYGIEAKNLKSVVFNWKLADEYKNLVPEAFMQVALDRSFNTIVSSVEITGKTEIDDLKLNNGKYFWRVGVLNPSTEKYDYTENRELNVLKELEAPVVTVPAENSILVLAEGMNVNLKWNKVTDADYYSVKVLDEDNSVIYNLPEVYENTLDLVLPLPENGKRKNIKYQISAGCVATDLNPARNGVQTEGSFNIRKPELITFVTPAENQEFDGLKALRSPVVLTWKNGADIPVSSEFILRKLQANGTEKIIETQKNPDKSIKLRRLTAGTYSWTIKAYSENGMSLSDEQFRTFTVKPVPELPKAVLKEPASNFVMDGAYLRKNRTIKFRWNSVAGATDYSFALYYRNSDGSLKWLAGGNTGNKTNFEIKDLSVMEIGTFEWQVTAYSHADDGYEEQRSRAAINRFKIDFKKPGKVKTKKPGTLYGE